MLLFAKMSCASMKFWRHYDVQKFDADTFLFRVLLCKKMDILMIKRRFQSFDADATLYLKIECKKMYI